MANKYITAKEARELALGRDYRNDSDTSRHTWMEFALSRIRQCANLGELDTLIVIDKDIDQPIEQFYRAIEELEREIRGLGYTVETCPWPFGEAHIYSIWIEWKEAQ